MKRLALVSVVWQKSRFRPLPRNGTWAVYWGPHLQTWFTKKTEAVAYARRIAKKRASPERGVTLRIKNKNGRYQEERTYPRSLDPKRSPG